MLRDASLTVAGGHAGGGRCPVAFGGSGAKLLSVWTRVCTGRTSNPHTSRAETPSDTPTSSVAAGWARRCGQARSQVACTPLSGGVREIGRRLVATQRVVDMKSWWHIRYLARVRLGSASTRGRAGTAGGDTDSAGWHGMACRPWLRSITVS